MRVARMIRLLSAIVASVFVVALLWAPRVGAAPPTGGFTETVTACDGTTLEVTGTAHGVNAFHQDAAGGTHLRVLTELQGTAVDPATGARYVFHEIEENDVLNSSIDGAETFSSVTSLRLIRVGPSSADDDLMIRSQVHTTVNANGEVTVDVSNFTMECR